MQHYERRREAIIKYPECPQMNYGILDTDTKRIISTCFSPGFLYTLKHNFAKDLPGYPTRYRMVRLQSSVDRMINGKVQLTHWYPGLRAIK